MAESGIKDQEDKPKQNKTQTRNKIIGNGVL